MDATNRISHEDEARWLRILIQLAILQAGMSASIAAQAARRWR